MATRNARTRSWSASVEGVSAATAAATAGCDCRPRSSREAMTERYASTVPRRALPDGGDEGRCRDKPPEVARGHAPGTDKLTR